MEDRTEGRGSSEDFSGLAGGDGSGRGQRDPELTLLSKPSTRYLPKQAPKRGRPAVRRDAKAPKTLALPAALAPKPISPGLTLPFKVGLNYVARFLPGGRETMIDLARLSDREKVRNVAVQYDQMQTAKRSSIPIEELCQTVDLSPADFISAVVGVAYSINMDTAKLISSMAHPDIIKAAVDKALTPEGFADRRMLLTGSEFLPKPSGIQVTQNNRNIAAAQARADSNGPSFEEVTKQVAEIVRR